MATIKLPIRNFPKQQSIFEQTTQYVIVPKGRRFGVTKGAANNFIRLALLGKFKKGLWVDTVNSNIERYVERYFMPALIKLGPAAYSWRKQQKILQIKDSYIDFRSVDTPENIEGFGYDYAFLNEAGIILRNEYLWYNAIQPMLLDYKAHTIIAGTPKGQGLFHKLYLRGLDKDQADYSALTFSTYDNPHIDSQAITDMIRDMPQRVVSQEIYAEFLDDTGIVFRGVNKVAVLDASNIPDVKIGHMYVIGADVAKIVDYTVIVVYDRTDNRQVFQMRFNNLEWPVVRHRLTEVSKKYNNALIYLDSTGVGEPIHDDLSRQNIPVEPVHFTNELKKQMIEKLSTYIELSRIQMLSIPETVNEFNSFTYDISASGRVIYNAPKGFHDDIVYAHALAVWGLNPAQIRKDPADMSIIERDLAIKTGKIQEEHQDEYEEIDGWGLYGESE